MLWGCGQPAGESGHNIGRVAGLLAGLHGVPGVTVNRYCSSSLMTIRMAAHAIKAGDGDVFIAGGVETISRNMAVGQLADGPKNPLFADAEARTAKRAEGGAPTWEAPAGLPDIYIAMGQTAENVAQYENVSRERQDEFAVLSQNRAEESLNSGYWEHEITPVDTPDGTVTKDDGIRPGTTLEKVSSLSPVFRPDGTVTAGNACPLNDGAAAVIVMSDTKAKALGLTPLARIVSSAATALNPEIMGMGPVEASRKALVRADMSIDDIDLRGDQRGIRCPGDPVGRAARRGVGQAQHPRRLDRSGASIRHDRCPHHDHADPQPHGVRRHLRPRDHVRRRRPGHGHGRRTPELIHPTGPAPQLPGPQYGTHRSRPSHRDGFCAFGVAGIVSA